MGAKEHHYGSDNSKLNTKNSKRFIEFTIFTAVLHG